MKTLTVLAALVLFATKTNAQTPVFSSYPSAAAVLFLDFDGQFINGTNWNVEGPLYCGPSNLNAAQVAEIFNRVAEDFRPFDLNVTTDSAVYDQAPINQRMRVVFTITSDWYGIAGGVAYTNSFTWGNNTPCFVFSALHKYNVKNIAEAASHEAGHTLGLRHQAVYDSSCHKISDYNSGIGSGSAGWAPIMGVGYYRNNTTWHHGPNPYSCTNEQDDLAIITTSNGFSYRPDDDTATDFREAVGLNTDTSQLAATGLIATNTDRDLFGFTMPGSGLLALTVRPYSIAGNDEGSNLDVQVQLYNKDHLLLNTFNPADKLSVAIDTTLAAGRYYISVSGASSPFASNYASLGAYSITGTVPPSGPVLVRTLQLRGTATGNKQQLNWIVEADATVTKQVLERSDDGITFTPVAELPAAVRRYAAAFTAAQYRLHVYFNYSRPYYTNSIALQNNAASKPHLYTNVIHSNQLMLNSPLSFTYTITDVNGQVLQRGEIAAGASIIQTPFLRNGLYLITFQNKKALVTEKFVRE